MDNMNISITKEPLFHINNNNINPHMECIYEIDFTKAPKSIKYTIYKNFQAMMEVKAARRVDKNQ